MSAGSIRALRPMALAAAAAALLLTGCATTPGGSTEAPGSESMTISVGVIPVAEFAPIFIAQDEGYFADEGLIVETQIIQNAASIAPSVINGQLQFGTAAAAPFLSAVSQSLPLTAVANGSSVSADAATDPSAILVMPDRGIERPADLVGTTVGVNALGSISHVTAAADVDLDGGDHTAVTFVAMPFPDMIAALERGTIDAAVVVEPFQVQGVEAGAVVLSHPSSDTLVPGTFTVLFTSQQYAAEHPDVVERFQRAVDKASLAAAEDPTLVATVLEEHFSFDPALFEQMRIPTYSAELSTEALQHLADLMVELGFMENSIVASDVVWAGRS